MGLSTINLSANNHKIYEKFPLDVNELEASKKLKFDVSDVSFLWKAFIDFELNSDLIKVTDLIKPKGTVAENTVSSQLFVEINKFLKMDPSTGEGGTAHFNPVTRKNELVDIFTDSLAVTHKDSVIDANTQGIEFLFKKNKIDWLKGWGKVTADDTVQVGKKKYKAKFSFCFKTSDEDIDVFWI